MKYFNHLKKAVIPILLVSFVTAGCATIFKGSHAGVRVNSAPTGANISINGINKGVTPQTLQLKRDKGYILTFKKEGYEPIKLQVEKKFDIGTSVVGNLFSWGLLGFVVDLASGAAYSLTPADLQANMAQLKNAGLVPEKTKIKKNEITVVMLTKEQWQKISK